MKISKIVSIIVLFGIGFAVVVDSGGDAITVFWNGPSVVLILVIWIPMMVLSDLLGDYCNAYRIAAGNTEFSKKEMKAACTALKSSVRFVYIAGILGTFIGIVNIMTKLTMPNIVGPSMVVAVLTILYSLVINIIHYAIMGKVQKEIDYRG